MHKFQARIFSCFVGRSETKSPVCDMVNLREVKIIPIFKKPNILPHIMYKKAAENANLKVPKNFVRVSILIKPCPRWQENAFFVKEIDLKNTHKSFFKKHTNCQLWRKLTAFHPRLLGGGRGDGGLAISPPAWSSKIFISV